MSDGLTARQAEVLGYIEGFSGEHGFPPTVRQIGKRFGIGSPNGVVSHLKALERKGLLRVDPRTARGLVSLRPSGPAVIVRGGQVHVVAPRGPLSVGEALGLAEEIRRACGAAGGPGEAGDE